MGKGVAAAAAAVLAVGCLVRAGPSPSKPIVEFPSAARLAAVEGKPATLPPIQSGEVPAGGMDRRAAGARARAREPAADAMGAAGSV